AGIVGRTRFTYDLWGDTVNVASRLEGASEPDTITLSRTTRDLLGNEFQCDPHGSINARNRGTIEIFRLKEQSL
ncbi:MAG: adenylate/guanylate cyclase domain-containing protein, partial [Leptospiraceae bacterium]|nr:adenylate/guanylate cyclase domain-containing protein [Leptospiraceae bacterium]